MRAPLLLALLTACDPFGRWTDDDEWYLDAELWDPEVAPTADGSLYVRLPAQGQLVRVKEDGSFATVDLDGAQADSMVVTPDGERVLVLARWPRCNNDDEEIVTVEDCPEDDLEWRHELDIVEEGKRIRTVDVPPHLDTFSFAPGGTTAVAWLSGDPYDVEIDGVADLTEIVFVDLATGDTQGLSIGFRPTDILFSEEGTRAVVLSNFQVTVVDLETREELVTYELATDIDANVVPKDAVLTSDGDWILLTVEGRSELFELNMSTFFIDIEDLPGEPFGLAEAADPEGELTLLLYGSLPQVDVLDHSDYQLREEPIELDEPVHHGLAVNGGALFYNVNDGHSIYLWDAISNEVDETAIENPLLDLALTGSGRFAVGLLGPELSGASEFQDSLYGLGVVDLAERQAASLVFEARPVGLALVDREGADYALALLEGVEDVYQIDLSDPSKALPIELPAPPVGIGALADGRFYITHRRALGLISFFDPADGALKTVGGFVTPALLPGETTLPRIEAN